MKLHILRLGSVVPEGVGGPEAGVIDLIYSFLLQEYNCDHYQHIHINQIGDDLEEMIMKTGKNIRTNIKYPAKGFDNKTLHEQNLIRLDVVHTALSRIAEKEKKLDIHNLEKIRDRIFEQNFEFDLLYKKFENKKDQLIGKIIIHPHNDRFCYYFTVEKNEQIVERILLYEGKCTHYYTSAIFHKGQWKGPNLFVIKDKPGQTELHVYVTENRVELINLTRYEKPPFFEMMKAGKTDEKVVQDWLHSLPPGIAGMINFDPN